MEVPCVFYNIQMKCSGLEESLLYLGQIASLLTLKKPEDVILKGLCAVDENGIIIFEPPTPAHINDSHLQPIHWL